MVSRKPTTHRNARPQWQLSLSMLGALALAAANSGCTRSRPLLWSLAPTYSYQQDPEALEALASLPVTGEAALSRYTNDAR